ncbi:MAG: CSN-associated deubiquitinating enzyme Ubp12 [Peltula sp. TS41687]|nr:MAG: CSN-associated deubiquitinating enzyme Ubp12 [Peltula sp. TS41687]
MPANDFDADRLRSPSVTASVPCLPRGLSTNNTDVMPARSTSPAIKRPASELDAEEDDGTQQTGSPLRSMYLPNEHSTQESTEEQTRGSAGGDWVSDAPKTGKVDAGIAISVTKNENTVAQIKSNVKTNSTNGRQSPAPAAGGMITRSKSQKYTRTIGTCGLTNLGNTCYMNSAIQCVRSVEELTQYFRAGKFKEELNPSNKLSRNGDVAKAYANLLDQMYAPTSPTSVTPRNFKNIIGRYGAAFSGCGQQDSQEFLGFLLDGLQEDLNRIQQKSYIGNPDSTDEMVTNPVALRALADKCWDIYKACNDSVIVDLFAGTYKSTLVCLVCEKVSITFDPFTNLTLQLPIENVWSRDIFYFPLQGRPIRIAVELDKNGSIKTLKEFIAKRVKVDSARLHAVEIYKNKFYKHYDDIDSVSECIQKDDDVGVYELHAVPTNWPPPKRKPQKSSSMLYSYQQSEDEEESPGWDSPMADQLLVPVIHRLAREPGSRYGASAPLGVPTYMVLTREEAWDYESILRKLLATIDTFTTANLSLDDSERSSASPDEDDMVVTTSEDADSSAGTRMKNHSVDGEEDFVAVSMGGSGEDSNVDHSVMTPTRSHNSPVRTTRAKILEPGSFIPPQYRNMFQMRIFRQTGEFVPTGWNVALEDERNVPPIENRIPSSPTESSPSERSYMPGDEPSSESGESQPRISSNNNALRLHGAGSDSESERMPEVREIIARRPKQTKKMAYRRDSRRKGARMKHTYSKKNKRFVADTVQKPTDHGPLVQLGEGILLDWSLSAHESLFLAPNPADEDQVSNTYEVIEFLKDDDLRRKRAQRANRKKQGLSLDDCLDEFGKEEILSESDAWNCPRCKEFRRASKKLELWKAPDILVVHLKRFSASRGLRDKLEIRVDFPVEGLDLKERVALKEDGKSTIYDLIAVDNHYGGLGGGHYTAMAKSFIDGNWYDYNDTMATKRTPQEAVTSAAYLLFYRRRSDRPLGGSYFEKIVEEASQQDGTLNTPRLSSPATGDDQDLDSSSRDGLSSALQVDGAGRQDPTEQASGMTENNNDEPPAYSKIDPNEGDGLTFTNFQRAGADDMDLDEGIDTNSFSLDPVVNSGPFKPSWGFDDAVVPGTTGPQVSSDEDLMDGISDKAVDDSSAGNFSDTTNRMADFESDDDDGDSDNAPGAILGDSSSYTNSPNQSSGGSPEAEIPDADPSLYVDRSKGDDDGVDEEDGPVADEEHTENEEGLKLKSD